MTTIKIIFYIFFKQFKSKTYISRYQAVKQKEQSKLKRQNTRLEHEIRRHKWQDNMNLY